MITYKKKSLHAEVIHPKNYGNSSNAILADNIAAFINPGEYSRIADIVILPATNSYYSRAVIIYEKEKTT